MEQKQKTTLHYTRIRAVDEPTFFDPQTDFRGLLPAVSRLTLMFFEDNLGKEHPKYKDVLYLHQCFTVFGIRIMEDPQPVQYQIKVFFDALSKCDKDVLFMWMRGFIRLLFTLYGLFVRRDVKTDPETFRRMFEYARFAQYDQVLDTETFDEFKALLKKANVFDDPVNVVTESGRIYCDETDNYIIGVQNLAKLFMSASNANVWEDMAEACDEQFSTNGVKTDQQQIVMALAYPNYDRPYLQLEQEKEETE